MNTLQYKISGKLPSCLTYRKQINKDFIQQENTPNFNPYASHLFTLMAGLFDPNVLLLTQPSINRDDRLSDKPGQQNK